MSAAVSPMQQREEIMDDEGCKSGSDDELDPGIVCVCVCVCVGVRLSEWLPEVHVERSIFQ